MANPYRTVRFVSGPRDGERMSWDGGSIIRVEKAPEIPSILARPEAIPADTRVAHGFYREDRDEPGVMRWGGWL